MPIHATILKAPSFKEEDHESLHDIIKNYERLFFENQNEQLAHMAVMVFNPLPPSSQNLSRLSPVKKFA